MTSAVDGADIDLAWTAPVSNGGPAITEYIVYTSVDAGAYSHVHTASTNLTYTVVAPAGGSYLFKVSALNSTGEGALSTATDPAIVIP
jgi:hypothetical protein